MALRKVWLDINGAERAVVCDPEQDTLADLLRRIGLTGTKIGCGVGQCGACSVILDGKVVRSCTKKMKNIKDFAKVLTIEGIGTARSLHPLQQAWITFGGVQCGFCSPGFIVSAYGLLEENPNPSREEVRQWFADHKNACRCTGWKPLVDCVMEAARVMRGEASMEDITFKPPADGQIYGSGVPRPAALGKVIGACDYGDDLALKMPPGTLHLAVVQPRVHHGRIKGIDVSEAEAMPGVVKVLTAKDVKGTNRIMLGLGHPRAKTDGFDRPLINGDKINRYGDIVAVVAANTREQARAAAAVVKADIEELPAYLNYLEAVAPGAQNIHEGVPNEFLDLPVIKGEDTRGVLENSEFVVDGSFYSTSQPHLVIEPESTQAYIDEDGCVCVHNKTLAIVLSLISLPAALGIPEDKLRVIENPTGASFGYSISPATTGLAAAAALALNAPVTLTMSYDEHQFYSGKRSAHYSNARLGCGKDGKITGFEYDFALERGAYSEMSDLLGGIGQRFPCFSYSIPSVRGLVRVGYSNKTYGTAYRAFGAAQSYTMSESLVDMLAEKAGIDPYDFRWINIGRPGDTNINGSAWKEYPFETLMEAVKPYYEQGKENAAKFNVPGKKRGVGITVGGYNVTGGSSDMAEVAIELMEDGTINHYNTWEDQGQGADVGTLVLTHKALEPLGVKWEDIHLVQADTKTCPITGPAGANRSHYMAGNATIDAATKLMDAMRKPDGSYRSYEEMAAEGIPTKYSGVFDTTPLNVPLDPNTGQGDPTPQYNYMAFVAEVEVDLATGKTTVLKQVMAYDIGAVGSQQAVDGQAYGALTHSLEFALSADYKDSKEYAYLIKCGFKFPDETPDDIVLINCATPREGAPFDSVGCCEGFQSAGHIAILNAINNAVGVRIYDLPASPEKVKAAMETKEEGKELKPDKYYLGPDPYEVLEEMQENPV